MIPHHTILSKQTLIRTPTELSYVEFSDFVKEVTTQKVLTSESGTQERINIPIWVIVGFQQSDRQGSQNFNKDTFCRLPVTSAQCIIGTEKNPDSAFLLNYDDDYYPQEYGQIKEAFRVLKKDDISKPYISD